jgi:hypothetical protein
MGYFANCKSVAGIDEVDMKSAIVNDQKKLPGGLG